jgi:MFS family permease
MNYITKNEHLYSSPTPDKPGFFYGYIIVGALFLIVMAQFGAQYSFGVFFKPMLDEFGWSRALTSSAYSMNVILQGLVMIIVGRLNDRLGPRIIITISGLFLCIGYCLMSRTNAIWQIYLFYGFFISLGSCIWVPALSTIARWFIKRRGLMSGIISSGIGIGIIVFPPIANYLIASHGWRLSFVIVGLSVAGIFIVTAQLLRRDPSQKLLLPYGFKEAATKIMNADTHGYSLKEAISTWQFWIICLTFFAASFCTQIVMVHIVPHAIDIGISPARAATIISVIGIFSIFSKIGVGSTTDKLGCKPVLVFVLVFVSLSFILLLKADQLWMFYLFAFVFALGYGSSAIQGPITAEYFGLKSHGTIMGVLMLGNSTGAIGPLIAGRIFDVNGNYKWAFLICIIIALIVLIAMLLLKPASQKESVNNN